MNDLFSYSYHAKKSHRMTYGLLQNAYCSLVKEHHGRTPYKFTEEEGGHSFKHLSKQQALIARLLIGGPPLFM